MISNLIIKINSTPLLMGYEILVSIATVLYWASFYINNNFYLNIVLILIYLIIFSNLSSIYNKILINYKNFNIHHIVYILLITAYVVSAEIIILYIDIVYIKIGSLFVYLYVATVNPIVFNFLEKE